MGNKKTTIGILIGCLHEPCQSKIWQGLSRYAKIRNTELVTFVSTSQDNVDTLENHYRLVGDFVERAALDGLITFGGAMESHRGSEFVENLVKKFSHLPAVSISSEMPGMPSVLVGNYPGVVSLVDHMVTLHHRKRIVFIKGPEGFLEAEERFSAYKYGLEKNNIPLEEKLIRPGNFSRESGVEAIKALCEEGIQFDAVVGADDFTALGAVSELRKRGFHVPTDVSVAGFDDEGTASITFPPLTTVKQPWYELGEAALEMVLKKIQGESVDDNVMLNAQVVVRRSCGCFPDSVRCIEPETVENHQNKEEIVANIAKKIRSKLPVGAAGISDDSSTYSTVRDIVDEFVASATKENQHDGFLNKLDVLFCELEHLQDPTGVLQDMLQDLTIHLGSLFPNMRDVNLANSLLRQGQSLLREYKLISLQAHNIEDAEFQVKIRETCQKIITTFDQERLIHLIRKKFPALEINRLVFAMYDVPGKTLTNTNWSFPERSRLLLNYNVNSGLDNIMPEVAAFPSAEIIPEQFGSMNGTDATNWIFMPVFFKAEHFGYIVFEHALGHPPFMYEELRLHLGSSLKSAFLMEELKIQSMMDELTGVQNRRGFMALGRKVLETARTCGAGTIVFYADLDKLKTINDTYGHEEGDAAIAGAAQILKNTFRKNDVIGRIGGDEFCVMLAVDNAMEPSENLVKRLNQHMAQFNANFNKPYEVSITVGMSVFEPDHNKSLDTILKEADARLMEQKRARKATERKALEEK